ncbi:nuclear transport factor 2 family protein [Mycolicibacterium aichiense]|uniref:SnoaL-like domain-containing protein n=2 Tax=Mycolicibacterium TaxID=1866885 RepID=A0AAD1HNE0_9MYCO|nr:nuclear transport factor 2 family protein [Mycolicibacterium aichiense]MCV7020373.1 nuclear transport factor 2 family protein [Mycolicibacterium aichiense]BBX07884.1 hypothetical protein MAIC_26870 [Mycolicibacterium aichiense]STZ81694.1 Uncharacterised protein [Mycolicibacterium aichiense]
MADLDILARLQRLEDQQDIATLIASYGPAVDAGDAHSAAGLWTHDGRYDVEGWQMSGRQGVYDMVASDSHQELVAKGCCHFLGPAVVTVDGDRAVAVCESLVLVRRQGHEDLDHTDQYCVWRATANHFALDRVDGRWQITTRVSRVLDGDRLAHALLGAGLAGDPAPLDGRG